jgi:hypothetical protein
MFVPWVVALGFGASCVGLTPYGSLWQRKDGLLSIYFVTLLPSTAIKAPISKVSLPY